MMVGLLDRLVSTNEGRAHSVTFIGIPLKVLMVVPNVRLSAVDDRMVWNSCGTQHTRVVSREPESISTHCHCDQPAYWRASESEHKTHRNPQH